MFYSLIDFDHNNWNVITAFNFAFIFVVYRVKTAYYYQRIPCHLDSSWFIAAYH